MTKKIENEIQNDGCKCKKACKLVMCAVLLLTFVSSACALYGTIKVNQKVDTILEAINLSPKKQKKADYDLISKKYDNKGQTLAKALKTEKPVLAFFYVDWCGYCQKFAPTFHKLTKDKAIKEKFALAYVNCEDAKNSEFVKEYGIQAFPTVFIINDDDKHQVDNQMLFEEFENLKTDLLK